MAQEEDHHPGTEHGCAIDEAHNNQEVENGQGHGYCECAGLIFLCNESTKMECFKYRVFGLSKKKKNLLDVITKGMCLFLFDVKLKVLHGIYAASSHGVFNLEPDAFGGNFPWQVKFHIEKACIPLPEDVFKTAIKDNYFASRKFKMELTSEQVQKLVKLFSPLPTPNLNLDEPRCNVSSFEAACTQIQDRHTEGILPPKATSTKADGLFERDPPPQILYEPTSPLLDGVLCEKYIHDHSAPQTVQDFPQCMRGCATYCMSYATMDNHQSSYEAADPVKGIMIRTCLHGFHAPGTHHEYIHRDAQEEGLVERPLNLYNGVMAKRFMPGLFDPGVQEPHTCVADKACIMLDLLPSHSQRCSSFAPPGSLCECMQIHLLPTSIQETLWDTKLQEPFVDSSLACSLPPKAPLKGVSYALPGHLCKVIGHKRPLQEMYVCAHCEAQGALFNTGETPSKCMYH